MKKRQMYMRMVTASLLRRRSRMVIALLAIAIGATILSGLVTIYVDVPRQLSQQFRSYGANMIITSSGEGFTQEDVDKAVSLIPKDQLVGVTPYRYDTVRINDRPGGHGSRHEHGRGAEDQSLLVRGRALAIC